MLNLETILTIEKAIREEANLLKLPAPRINLLEPPVKLRKKPKREMTITIVSRMYHRFFQKFFPLIHICKRISTAKIKMKTEFKIYKTMEELGPTTPYKQKTTMFATINNVTKM